MVKNKNLTIAFLYNVRHRYPDPQDPLTQLEIDFYDPATIEAMIRNFKQCGYKVIPIEADQKAYFKLYKYRKQIDLAFNDAEGIYGLDREAQIPAILEMLQIPYTGPGPLTEGLVLNKAKAKEILQANGIPTLPFQVFRIAHDKLKEELKFPLIVKPVAQGSSAGVTNKSVVNNKKSLLEQILWVLKTFNQPALVEPFLSGREFSVAMLGNPPEILPILEANHASLPKDYLPMDSLEVKWIFEEKGGENHLICPAKIDFELKQKIKQVCLTTWRALEIRDYTRIDVRCDEKENPFVLEVNSPAGMIPPEVSTTSYFPLAARTAGISYPQVLRLIINTAIARYSSKSLSQL